MCVLGGGVGKRKREEIVVVLFGVFLWGCVAVDDSIFGGLVGWLFFLSGTFFLSRDDKRY